MNFYALIIGTEILNGRREDKHFSFLKNELSKYGHTLHASFIIKDDPKLLENIFKFIKNDKNSIMFSFGGIGSTPDDLTREIASKIFRDSKTVTHPEFLKDILNRFKEEAYPHRINMAKLPPNSNLIKNPINNMSGFYLDNRFFFVPGFPSMAHPMLSSIIKNKFNKKTILYRKTLLADTSENTLINIMQQLPNEIELSSLPMFVNQKPKVELSLSSKDKIILNKYFNLFKMELEKKDIKYKILQ